MGYLPEAVSVPMKKAGNFKLDKVPLKILKLSNKCFQTSVIHQQWLGIVVRTPDLHTAVKTVRGSNPERGNKGNKGRKFFPAIFWQSHTQNINVNYGLFW